MRPAILPAKQPIVMHPTIGVRLFVAQRAFTLLGADMQYRSLGNVVPNLAAMQDLNARVDVFAGGSKAGFRSVVVNGDHAIGHALKTPVVIAQDHAIGNCDDEETSASDNGNKSRRVGSGPVLTHVEDFTQYRIACQGSHGY